MNRNREENNKQTLFQERVISSLSGKQEVNQSLVGLGSDSGLGSTTDLTSASSSDETGLLTSGASSGHGRWVTNMLLVTTTVGMVDGVHSNTSDTGPSVSLGLVLPE